MLAAASMAAAELPVKRVGTPDDVAHAVSYLLDERSGFVTGQVLYVCGGMTVGVAGGVGFDGLATLARAGLE